MSDMNSGTRGKGPSNHSKLNKGSSSRAGIQRGKTTPKASTGGDRITFAERRALREKAEAREADERTAKYRSNRETTSGGSYSSRTTSAKAGSSGAAAGKTTASRYSKIASARYKTNSSGGYSSNPSVRSGNTTTSKSGSKTSAPNMAASKQVPRNKKVTGAVETKPVNTKEKKQKKTWFKKAEKQPNRVTFTEIREAQEAKKPLRPHAMDYKVFFLTLFLFSFGLIMIFSTSSYSASIRYDDPAYFMIRQMLIGLGGIVCMLIITRIDYHLYQKFHWLITSAYWANILLLVATLILAVATKGSKRWIGVGGFKVQPSEIAKVVIIVFLADYIESHINEMKTWLGILKAFAWSAPVIGLVATENLSTAILLLGICSIMIFVSTPLFAPFFAALGVGVAAMVAFLFSQPYRLERVYDWLDPTRSDPSSQTIQGLYAIGSGGIIGKGLGNSLQKNGSVAESHNDMIFSIICEEIGLFGAICIILLFVYLLLRIYHISLSTPDIFGSMIAIGAIAHIGLQVFVNIGVVTKTLPNTGVPLPFISYGGTSVMFLMMEMGLVLSVSRFIRYNR